MTQDEILAEIRAALSPVAPREEDGWFSLERLVQVGGSTPSVVYKTLRKQSGQWEKMYHQRQVYYRRVSQ